MDRLVSAFLRISPRANAPFVWWVRYLNEHFGVSRPIFCDLH
jgi:hypothetical protein